MGVKRERDIDFGEVGLSFWQAGGALLSTSRLHQPQDGLPEAPRAAFGGDAMAMVGENVAKR